METLKNILSNEELQVKFDHVCAKNWLIFKIAEAIKGNSARELINNWPVATRNQLLSKMNICEHETYKQLYQDAPSKSKKLEE